MRVRVGFGVRMGLFHTTHTVYRVSDLIAWSLSKIYYIEHPVNECDTRTQEQMVSKTCFENHTTGTYY